MTHILFTISTAFMLGLTGLTFHRTHLLSALLCLEGMMLSLFIALAMWSTQNDMMIFSSSPLLLLALSACEAGLGLSLLVATSRTHGSDHLQNLNLLQC
ncbi:NADH dehydrogenase subunit 4L (mitochondrion) [Erpetoichthys calabaricus]|uniref:NADH-ubiquinone oxidoreductase chain 4L n=1 Tax=Erpetoichthys calabaricus TaxID=27687 RepID=Q8HMT5_ERPCA|nr:NADH dehydrogenase subunit 4L [Erpetoichthys calabaricus]AAR16111.1 NADH dehydrogenase subunit 4L [Erpetoichthys calabaricus]ADG95148.1 NADH dehydrogenase subunit 4L [Erpetoichthys calabaricus]BAC23927.1 NADH dehydrogenase subunit 4L [Erpetoichthys calabaricus]CAE48124.1 NADH4L protein [Erpetoichthys calabaricus]